MRAQDLGDDEDEVRGGRPPWQRAVEADADHVRHRLVERLPEQHGFRLDPADAVAEDTQAVDHRRVGIGPDERVGEGDATARPVLAIRHDGGEELEVDLVDDARPRRHDAQVAKSRLSPAEQLIPLAVAVVLALDVVSERARRPEPVDLD